MRAVNIHEAKTHLSRYLAKVAKGETILLCKRNVPIAEIRALPKPDKTPRLIGGCKGEFEVTPAFFEPLPEDILRAFNGED